MFNLIKKTVIGLVVLYATVALAQDPTIVWQVQAYSSQVSALSYSWDGQTIATGSGLHDNPIKFWAAEDGALQQTFDLESNGVISVDLSTGGQYLAAGYAVGGYPPGALANVWDVPTQTFLNEFGGGYVAFSPDAMTIASGGGSVSRYLQLHDIATGNQIFSIYTGSYILDVAYSPDGQGIATGQSNSIFSNSNVKIWDAMTGNLIQALTGHLEDVSTVAFSADGELLASGEGGYEIAGQSYIKLWNVSSGALLLTLDGHGDWVYDLDFSPDGQYLISSGRESLSPLSQKIKIWRVSDGELMVEYEEAAWCINYSPDGQYFAYGSPYGDLFLAENPLAAQDLSVTLTPVNPPIIIPNGGSSFDLNIEVTNNEATSATFDVWTMVTLPSGSEFGPLIWPANLTFGPGFSANRDRTQDVPASAPAGMYTYDAYVGVYPDDIWDEDHFDFEKSAVGDGGYIVSGWESRGADFDELAYENKARFTPMGYALLGAYPNPFNPTTAISYQISAVSFVNLAVYNISGRMVTEVVNGWRDAGVHEVTFDGSSLASGIYVYRLEAGQFSAVGKMMLVK